MSNTGLTYLGIDYGTKRVGIATGNSIVRIATPLVVLANDRDLVSSIHNLIHEHKVTSVVLGLSKKLDNSLNTVAEEIEMFSEEIEEKSDVDIFFEDERFTSFEAQRYAEKGARVDASAAALILQTFLDRMS